MCNFNIFLPFIAHFSYYSLSFHHSQFAWSSSLLPSRFGRSYFTFSGNISPLHGQPLTNIYLCPPLSNYECSSFLSSLNISIPLALIPSSNPSISYLVSSGQVAFGKVSEGVRKCNPQWILATLHDTRVLKNWKMWWKEEGKEEKESNSFTYFFFYAFFCMCWVMMTKSLMWLD